MSKSINIQGFKKFVPTKTKRRIISVEGLEKCGKTHFALTAPGPIAFFNFDNGMEGVVDKFCDGTVANKDILYVDYSLPPSEFDERPNPNGNPKFLEVWRGFWEDFNRALKSPDIRTLIVDTATECWEILRMGRFGKLTQVMPHNYGPVNAEYESLHKRAYDTDKIVILLHKYRQEFLKDKWTGKYERAGYSKIGYVVQDIIRTHREEGTADFSSTVIMSRKNIDKIGSVYEGELSNFPFVIADITGTDPSDWE